MLPTSHLVGIFSKEVRHYTWENIFKERAPNLSVFQGTLKAGVVGRGPVGATAPLKDTSLYFCMHIGRILEIEIWIVQKSILQKSTYLPLMHLQGFAKDYHWQKLHGIQKNLLKY